MANRPNPNAFQYLKLKWGRKEESGGRQEGGSKGGEEEGVYISAYIRHVREICHFVSFSFAASLNLNFRLHEP